MFKNFYRSLLLGILGVSSFGVFSSSDLELSHDISITMPFKIGFEFQENKKLCRWALEEKYISILKEPLFSITDNETNKNLCTIVIDDGDIEFITEPFSYKEKDLMNLSLLTIQKICNILRVDAIPDALLIEALQSDMIKKVSTNPSTLNKIKNTLKNNEIENSLRYYQIWRNWLISYGKQDQEIDELWNDQERNSAFTLKNIIDLAKLKKPEVITFIEWHAQIQRELDNVRVRLYKDNFNW